MKKLFSATALSVCLTLGATVGVTTIQANEVTQTK